MDLLAQFKKHLLQDKKHHSKVTVKNYIADVRRFIYWFENAFHTEFLPNLITKQIADIYKSQSLNPNAQNQVSAARSFKRYESSLRKFYSFLLASNLTSQNPFEIEIKQDAIQTDLFHLKEFKNYILLSGISSITRKNYLLDINHFVEWLKKVPDGKNPNKINSALVDEYKNRLLFEAKFAPASVNRKLSSLRKYFIWAKSQNIINQAPNFEQIQVSQAEVNVQKESPVAFSTFEAKPENEFIYSGFAPVRLLQKMFIFSNSIFDLLLIIPVVKTTAYIKYNVWKLAGRNVFTNPIDELITQEQAGVAVKSLPKAFFAPLKISTQSLSPYKRIIYHLVHTRPLWYKKYHSHRVTHYIHFGALLVYSIFLGFSIHNALLDKTNMQPGVLGAKESAVRMLAFSGRLTDASNIPITKPSNLRFALYTDRVATGSALLWQEVQQVKPDDDGNFKTLLGRNQGISQSILTENPALFLGITITNREELKPRQQVATIAYSKESEQLQGMLPSTDPNAGTSNIILALDSSGNLTIGGHASHRFEITEGEFILSGQTLTLTTTVDSNSNIQLSPDGTGIIDIQKTIQNTTNYSMEPGLEGMVQIADSLAIVSSSSTQSALLINQNGLGSLISASSSGTAKFTVDYLGAGMFADDLGVNGNNLTSDSYTFNLLNKNVINLNIGGDASEVSIGASSGATFINNNLTVKGTISANGGLTIPQDKNLTLEGFTAGSIPFIGNDKQISQDINNLFWDNNNKRLGIGTILPSFRLSVEDSKDSTPISQIYNTDAGTDADGLSIKLGNTSGSAVDNSNHFINFETVGLGEVGSIRGNGSNGIQVVNGSFADWAEYFDKDQNEQIPFGSIVCIRNDGKTTACDDYENKIIGVASEHPTVIAGKNKGDLSIAVGLTGIVKVFVSNENGSIKPGDLITSSASSGIGIKASDKGMIVGRALESYESINENEVGSILVVLQISQYNPEYEFSKDGDLALINQPQISLNPTDQSYAQIGEINGDLSGALSIKLENDKLNIFNSQLSANSYQLTANSLVASIDGKGNASFAGDIEARNASFSGTLRAGKIIADEIEGLDEKIASLAAQTNITNITNIYNNVASSSSELATDISSSSALIESLQEINHQLTGNFPTFSQGLLALGASSLTDVSINGSLYLGESTNFSENAINSIGANLELQSLRQGNLSIMGELVTIDTEGNLDVKGNATFGKDVQVKGVLSANIISPVPDSDLIIQLPGSDLVVKDEKNNDVFNLNNLGNLIASGSGRFKDLATEAITVIRGVQADSSLTETTASGSAGTGVIKANQTERTIITPFVKKDSLIYVTPVSNTQGLVPYIARQVAESKNIKGSFTIQIPYNVNKDIKFNWWIVN